MAILELANRGVGLSDDECDSVRSLMAQLVQACEGIVACRLLVDVAPRRYRAGQRCIIRVAVTARGRTIVVRRRAPSDPIDLAAEALDRVQRQLRLETEGHTSRAPARDL
jgi:hypothetical protein